MGVHGENEMGELGLELERDVRGILFEGCEIGRLPRGGDEARYSVRQGVGARRCVGLIGPARVVPRGAQRL